MLQSTQLQPTPSQLPVQIFFDPSPILHQQSHAANGVSYDPETGVLVYQQRTEPVGPPIQFVFPATIAGHTVTVSNAVVAGGQLMLPVLEMYQQTSVEVTFTPTTGATEGKVAKKKMAIDVRVRPTGAG